MHAVSTGLSASALQTKSLDIRLSTVSLPGLLSPRTCPFRRNPTICRLQTTDDPTAPLFYTTTGWQTTRLRSHFHLPIGRFVYVSSYSSPGAAAELAAFRKTDKYAGLPKSHLFQHVTLKNLGVTLNSRLSRDISFIVELSRKLYVKADDERE